MPELPEVEVIVRELREKLIGQKFKKVEIFWQRSYVNTTGRNPAQLTINGINRQGKYIIINVADFYMIVHLRMTGQLIVSENEDFEFRHLRVSFKLKSGQFLNFFDARKFGRIYFVKDPSEVLKKVGIDALNPDFIPAVFKKMIRDKKAKVKSVLLDQKFISGLGNIYTDESLFLAGIHPESHVCSLSDAKLNTLHRSIIQILNTAIDNMGTTLSDYRTTGGGFGDNQHYLKVYGRKDESCFICGSKIQKITVSSRGTHFCPVCQKLYLEKS